jgi:hypothetical protein
MEIKRVTEGLEIIDRLNRRGLLVALDYETSKSNTERLRGKVRLLWLAGSPRVDIMHGLLESK